VIVDDIDALSIDQLLWLLSPRPDTDDEDSTQYQGSTQDRGGMQDGANASDGERTRRSIRSSTTAYGSPRRSFTRERDLVLGSDADMATESSAGSASAHATSGSLFLPTAQPYTAVPRFDGQTMAGIFEHPSLRTRSAFAGAAHRVGALPVFFVGDEVGIDQRESAEDVAHLLAEHHRLIGARLKRHSTFTRMAQVATEYGCPMVNLLTDWAHPTQAIADLITIVHELGVGPGESLPHVRIAYLGEANNVARSLTKGALALGWDITIAAPEGHQFGVDDVASFANYRSLCGSDARLELTDDPSAAVREANVLYTDVWVSMGAESSAAQVMEEFRGFAIDEALLSIAPDDAFVMHCLPAHRGMEIEGSVIDSERSVVWDQARNRLVAMERLFRLIGEED